MSTPPDDDLLARLGDIPDPGDLARGPLPPLRVPSIDAPARTVVQQRRVLALVASVAWLGAHLVVYGVRPDLRQLPALYVAAQIALPFLTALVSVFVGLASGKLGLGLRVGLVSVLTVLGPTAFALIALGAPVPSVVPDGAGSLIGMLVCFDITVAWAAVPLLFAALAYRGAFPAAARWRSALVGAGAGLFAGAVMNLHCPNLAPAHMLFGHGLPVILATLAGALLLARRARA